MTLHKDPDRTEIKFLRRYVELENARLLEVGCGEGRLTWQYAQAPHSTVGVDLDRDSLRVARADLPVSLDGRVHLACADSIYLPFAKEKFDLAILAWSL